VLRDPKTNITPRFLDRSHQSLGQFNCRTGSYPAAWPIRHPSRECSSKDGSNRYSRHLTSELKCRILIQSDAASIFWPDKLPGV